MKRWWQRFCRGYSDEDLRSLKEKIRTGVDPRIPRTKWENHALALGLPRGELIRLALEGTPRGQAGD